MTLDEINRLDRDAFIAALGGAFEHAPWVAAGAWARRPFASADALHAAMFDVVQGADSATQLAFLRGHPELAGREAQAGTMTRESVGEQASAGLDALSRDEAAELRRLNAAYLERHGFPFVVAVRRSTKSQIFASLRSRLARSRREEFAEALAQIAAITRLRVGALVG